LLLYNKTSVNHIQNTVCGPVTKVWKY